MKMSSYEFSPEVVAKAEEIFDATHPLELKATVRPFALWRDESKTYFAHLATKALEREATDGL